MKAHLLLVIAAFFYFPSRDITAQTTSLSTDSIIEEINHNICSNFSSEDYLTQKNVDAPSPVRTLNNNSEELNFLTSEESQLYQKLGLTKLRDSSYGCIVESPNDSTIQYTIFKVKKVEGVLVVSTFLDEGKFLTGQEKAATELFLAMIDFYTEIPRPYYSGIKRYFQEFYLRILNGRITPSTNQTYAVDEPAKTIVVYHPLRGGILGTGLSLNIPLSNKYPKKLP